MGFAATSLRLEIGEELQGKEAGGAADHASTGQGQTERAQLRCTGQAETRDDKAKGKR